MLSLLQRGLRGRCNFTNIDICSCNLCPSSHLPSLCLHTHSPLLSISAWWPLTFITTTLSLFAHPLSIIIYICLVTFDLHHTYPLSVCTPSLCDYLYWLDDLWPSSHLPSLCLRSHSLLLSISAWWPLWPLLRSSLCDYLYQIGDLWPSPHLVSLCLRSLSLIIYICLVTFDLHHIYPLSVCNPSLYNHLYLLGDLWPSSNLPSFCLRSLSLWLSISARVTLPCGTGPVFFMEAISSSWSFCSSFFLSNCSCLFFSLSSWNQDNMPHL